MRDGLFGCWMVACLCFAGCEPPPRTAAAPSAPVVVFPSRDDLARVPSVVPRAEAFGAGDIAVEKWTFEAQASDDGAAYDDPSPWGAMARDLVAGHEATTTLSAPMRCTALELARFHAMNGAMPSESLRRFMSARCGSVVVGVMPAYWTVTSPAPPDDAEIEPKAREGLAKLLGDRLASGHWVLGAGAAREGQRTTVVVVLGRDQVRLEPGTFAADAMRHVTLRGASREPFAEIGALVNRGVAGAAPCTPDPGVQPPRFALTCELAAGDPFAWVEILGRRKDQLLLHELAEAILRPGDGGAIEYEARHLGPPAPVTGPADFTTTLVDRLNRVRADAGLTPLALAAQQSAQNARIAGVLIDASQSDDDTRAGVAALGLLAGWDVRGLVRDGKFFLGAVGDTRDATAWLDFALERPMGRRALLDPQVRQIAIGPAFPDGGGSIGAAVTTYALFESDDDSAEATRFFQRIVAARAARGLPAPARVQGLGEMDAELARVVRDGEAPMAALDAVMRTAVDRTGHGVHGYTLETRDVDAGALPEVLLAPGPLHLMVGVTHHRAKGAAWGQYVVLLVVLGG